MSLLRNLADGLRSLLGKERAGQELDEELHGFLEMAAEEKMNQGLSRQDALRAVRLERGSLEVTKEVVRTAGWESFLETCWRDMRFAARRLWKNPGFTVVAVLTLALGIGAHSAIFSVVNSVLLQPLPYKDPGKLVFVWSTMISQGVPISGLAAPDFREFRDRNRVFSGMAAYTYAGFNLELPGEEPSRLQGAAISANLFSVLGVNPILGRMFLPEEEQWGRHRSVLLGYAFWQTKFGGNRDIVGRNLRLNSQEYTVAGVLPKGMPFFDDLPRVDLWVPLSYAPNDEMNTRGNHYLNVIARLKPATNLKATATELSGIASQLEQQFPENKGIGAKVVPVREQLVGDVRSALLILLGAVAFVLLIACANIANLMLTRATARQQEFAVRSACVPKGNPLLRANITRTASRRRAHGFGRHSARYLENGAREHRPMDDCRSRARSPRCLGVRASDAIPVIRCASTRPYASRLGPRFADGCRVGGGLDSRAAGNEGRPDDCLALRVSACWRLTVHSNRKPVCH